MAAAAEVGPIAAGGEMDPRPPWPDLPTWSPSGMVQSGSPTVPIAVGPSTTLPDEPPGSSLPSDTSDEIMDLLVQSVTKNSPRALAVRERKRSRGNRKSCKYGSQAYCPPQPHNPLQSYSVSAVRRTLKSGLGDDLVQALGLSKTPGLEV